MPHNPFSPIQEDYSGRTPAYPVGVDDFSFPHFDWPARIVAKEAHLAGELPLWNPHAGLGVPLVGQYEPQILFPLEILERFLGLEGWQFMVLLRAVLAGTGAYLLLTSVAAAPASRLAGALFYALSACFVWFVSIPAFVSGAMLVPWLFWAAWSLALTKFSAFRAAAHRFPAACDLAASRPSRRSAPRS